MTTNDFDPTTNRIPFGLLSEDEQTALIHWPHGIKFWWNGVWCQSASCWESDTVYRGKPAPVVTSEWFNVYPHQVTNGNHLTRKEAKLGSYNVSRNEANRSADPHRIAVLRIDTCNGVSTAHLEEI